MEDIDLSLFSVENNSEAETSSTILSTSSVDSLNRKKQKTLFSAKTNIKFRSNRSHTTYFFRFNSNDSSIVYCKICEINLAGTRQKPYAYNRKGGNTTNLIHHLREKHDITKENYLEFLDEYNEVSTNCILLKV